MSQPPVKGKKSVKDNGPKEASPSLSASPDAMRSGKTAVVSPPSRREPKTSPHPAGPEVDQSNASKRVAKQVRQRSMGDFFLKPAIRNPSDNTDGSQPNPAEPTIPSSDPTVPSPTFSPPRKKFRIGPELYPHGKKGGRMKRVMSNYGTRYSLTF